MRFSVDFKKPLRPVSEMCGMNNGPLNLFTDRTAEFRDLGVSFVRFHETHSMNTDCVEIPFIFRDKSKDESKPENYYFGETDAVIKAAHDEGIEIMYRLGMGTETPPYIFTEVPPDYDKWARIAEHIIMHYNEGWANGFHYGIKYWEIWNEADIVEYWPGKRMEYINFYSHVSNYLKKRFPDILIGPSGFANMLDPAHEELGQDPEKAIKSRVKFFNTLFKRAASGEYPMDFFAWHIYGKDSAKTEKYCSQIDGLYDKYKMRGKAENINTEWNMLSLKRLDGRPGVWDMYQTVQMKSAIALINSMIVMQKHGVTKAAYYRPDECSRFCGLYDFDGTKRNHYYSFKAFKMLKQAKTEVETTGGSDTVRICAAADKKTAVILIGNEGDKPETATVTLNGIEKLPYTLHAFDEKRKLIPARRAILPDRAMNIKLGPESAAVVVIDKEVK